MYLEYTCCMCVYVHTNIYTLENVYRMNLLYMCTLAHLCKFALALLTLLCMIETAVFD